LASRVDLLESKARLDTADAQVLKSENEWREAKRKLHKIIGGERGLQAGVDSQQLPTEADALLQLKELEFKLDDVSYWVDASSENIQRRMAVLGVQLMKSDRNIAIAGRYPTLTFSADLENSRHDDPTVLEGSRSKVGFELIIPLLDGGRTTSSIRKAEARTTQAEEELRDSIETTELNVRTVLDLLRNDRANIDAMALSVESAAALLQAVEESHKVGLKDLGSVLDAKAGLYATKRRMAEAVYTAILHRLQLNQAVGHLSERELKVIDRWLVN